MHWKNLEWAYPKNRDYTKSPLFNSTLKYYIKDVKNFCDFFDNEKLKPIDYDAFVKHKEFSAALPSNVVPTVGKKASNNASRKIYKINLNKYKVKTKKTSFSFTEGNKTNCDKMSIGLAYLSFQKRSIL